MNHRFLLATLATAAALAAAGCGDDDEDTTTTAEALTQEEFVAQANTICSEGEQGINRAANEVFTGQQPTEAEIEQFANDVLVPAIQGQIDAIRALGPPEEIAADVETFLDDAQSALDEIEADPSLLAAADTPNDPFADVNRQADALGLTECAG